MSSNDNKQSQQSRIKSNYRRPASTVPKQTYDGNKFNRFCNGSDLLALIEMYGMDTFKFEKKKIPAKGAVTYLDMFIKNKNGEYEDWSLGGIITFRDVCTLASNIIDINDTDKIIEVFTSEPKRQLARTTFTTISSESGKLGELMLKLQDIWAYHSRKIMDLLELAKVHPIIKSTKKTGEVIPPENRYVNMKLEFGTFPANHPIEKLRNRKRTTIEDWTTRVVKDGFESIEEYKIDDKPVSFENVHIIGTKGSKIYKIRLYLQTPCLSLVGYSWKFSWISFGFEFVPPSNDFPDQRVDEEDTPQNPDEDEIANTYNHMAISDIQHNPKLNEKNIPESNKIILETTGDISESTEDILNQLADGDDI